MRNEQELTHPSYCMVSFSQRSGFPKLFGSAIETHHNYITLQVKKCSLIRDDSGDRYFGSMSGDIVEVDLSPAQFSQLLTTMNHGMGVPATLRRFDNKAVPEPPDVKTEAAHISDSFKDDLKKFVNSLLKNSVPRAEEILAKKTLTVQDKNELRGIIYSVSNQLKDHAPFIMDMFTEAVEKKVSVAKAEVDSMFTSVITKLGMKSLEQLGKVLEIGDGKS